MLFYYKRLKPEHRKISLLEILKYIDLEFSFIIKKLMFR